MFIRFEDGETKIGVYQGDLDYCDPKFMGIFELLGIITRAPFWYASSVKGHVCLGVDEHLGEAIRGNDYLRFAWRYDFFLRICNGDLTEIEWETIEGREIQNLQFLNTEERRLKFIDTCIRSGINIFVVDGTPIATTEQQVVIHLDDLEFKDELTCSDHYMFDPDAVVF